MNDKMKETKRKLEILSGSDLVNNPEKYLTDKDKLIQKLAKEYSLIKIKKEESNKKIEMLFSENYYKYLNDPSVEIREFAEKGYKLQKEKNILFLFLILFYILTFFILLL